MSVRQYTMPADEGMTAPTVFINGVPSNILKQTNVPADGAQTAINFQNAFATQCNGVLVMLGAYSAGDNAQLGWDMVGVATKNGFNLKVHGGAPGSTVTVYYLPFGS
jgi:hypothetical protein